MNVRVRTGRQMVGGERMNHAGIDRLIVAMTFYNAMAELERQSPMTDPRRRDGMEKLEKIILEALKQVTE